MATDATLEKQERFFEAFIQERGDFSAALKVIEVGRTTFYRWLREDEIFRDRYDKYRITLAEEIENAAVARVLNPTSTRGTDALAVKLLTGLKPERYAEKRDAQQNSTIVYISGLRDTPRPGVTLGNDSARNPDCADAPALPEPLEVVPAGLLPVQGVRDHSARGEGAQGGEPTGGK